MGKEVDIGSQQVPLGALIPKYVKPHSNCNKKPAYEPKTVLIPFHWDGHKSCHYVPQKLFFWLTL